MSGDAALVSTIATCRISRIEPATSRPASVSGALFPARIKSSPSLP